MIKTLLLASALTMTAPTAQTEPTTPPTTEVEKDFVEVTYRIGDKTITLKNESECEIKVKDTITIGTYVLDKTELTILTLEGSTTYTINEDGTLTEKSFFDIEKWLSDFFSPQQVAMIMSWITYIGTIVLIVAKFIRLRKDKNLTLENVKDAVLTEVGDKVSTEIKEQTATTLDALVKTCENQNEVLKLFTQIMALSQENTPESRVAILQLISKLGVIDDKTIDKSIEIVQNEVKAKEEIKAETIKQVEEVKKVTIKTDGTSI